MNTKNWIERQRRDAYVKQSKVDGLASRAAFKLSEIDDRFRLIKLDNTVIDLGAAPGGWSQIALKRVGAKGKVVIRIEK